MYKLDIGTVRKGPKSGHQGSGDLSLRNSACFCGGKHEDELEQTFHIVVAAGFVFLQLRKKDWEEVENKLFFGLEPLLSPLREAGHRKDSFPRLS